MNRKQFRLLISIALCGFLLYLGIHYWPSISLLISNLVSSAMPLILGFGIAYIVDIVMESYEKLLFSRAKKKVLLAMKRPLCLLLSFLSIAAVFSIVIYLVLPQLVDSVKLILQMLPAAMDKLVDFVAKFDLLSGDILSALEAIDWKSRIEGLVDVVTSGMTGVVTLLIETVTGVISGIITGLFSLIFSIYLLLGKEKLKNQIRRLSRAFLPDSIYKGAVYVLHQLNIAFRRYLIGQCTEAVILGLLCAAGMLLLRLPYAAMISAVIAFTALIPIAGAYIGAGVGAFMILTVSPIKALVFLIFLVLLQQVESNLIYPRVVGSSLGLPGIWVLAAVTIGGGIAGIPGMFLGVPMMAALYRILRDILKAREKAKAAQQAPEEEA